MEETTEQTAEKSLITAGQRRINIIWEITQALIALTVTISAIYVAASLALGGDTNSAAFLLLSNAFFVIIGFYFGRTNHQRTGGVGATDGRTR